MQPQQQHQFQPRQTHQQELLNGSQERRTIFVFATGTPAAETLSTSERLAAPQGRLICNLNDTTFYQRSPSPSSKAWCAAPWPAVLARSRFSKIKMCSPSLHSRSITLPVRPTARIKSTSTAGACKCSPLRIPPVHSVDDSDSSCDGDDAGEDDGMGALHCALLWLGIFCLGSN